MLGKKNTISGLGFLGWWQVGGTGGVSSAFGSNGVEASILKPGRHAMA